MDATENVRSDRVKSEVRDSTVLTEKCDKVEEALAEPNGDNQPDGLIRRKRKSEHKDEEGRSKKRLTKDDISDPTGFIHVFHAEGSPGTDVDLRWLILLNAVGVTNAQLQDHDTAKFIYSFVKEKGGIEIAVKDLREVSPTSTVSSIQIDEDMHAPIREMSPPPTQDQAPTAPPPPFPTEEKPNRQWLEDSHEESMSQIRKGVPLKKVEIRPEDEKSNKPTENLMKDIREGVALRPVPKCEKTPQAERQLSGIAGALLRALEERQKLIHPPDEDEDTEEELDPDWKQ